MLAETDHKIALLGTQTAGQQAREIDTRLRAWVCQARDSSPERSFLLTTGVQRLRERCGYVPNYDHRPLAAPAARPLGAPCSQRAMSHLRLMLGGVFHEALPEWLSTVGAMGQHARPEVLPELLALGQRDEALRPYLLPVIGERGLWLALEITNQNWKWVFDTPAVDLLMPDFDGASEAAIFEALYSQPAGFSKAVIELLDAYRQVWSPKLTAAILDRLTMRDRLKPAEVIETQQRAISWAYRYHLSSSALVVARLAHLFGNPGGERQATQEIEVILDFRRDMLKAITDEEED